MNSNLEAAIREAYATAPVDTVVLYTMEIRHETLSEPVRVVRWPMSGPEPDEFRLKLEADAPADAGRTVTFIGVPFELKLPEKSQDTPGQFEIELPAAGFILEEYCENAALHGGAITATFRTYILGREAEGPVEVWPEIYLQSPSIDSGTGNVTITGSVLDWLNRKFGRLYRPSEFPALRGR